MAPKWCGTRCTRQSVRRRNRFLKLEQCQFLKVEPGFDPLRDDPRFKEVMQRMKFPE